MSDALEKVTLETESPAKALTLKIVGVGSAGLNIVADLIRREVRGVDFAVVHTNSKALVGSSAREKLLLDTAPIRGLGTGGDPDRGRSLAEESFEKLKELCRGSGVVFIVGGLGGGAGTGIAPVLARAARETGSLAIAFVTQPFDGECGYRQKVAQQGLYELKSQADGVVCLPNQKVVSLVDEKASVLTVFERANVLMSDAVRAVWRLLTSTGPIEIHFEKVCALIREGAGESAFAVAEAEGPARAKSAVELLLAHPLLENGKILEGAGSVLLSIIGGTDLTMAELNRVVHEVRSRCEGAQVFMGTAVDPNYQDRIVLTVFATPRDPTSIEVEPNRPAMSCTARAANGSAVAQPPVRASEPVTASPRRNDLPAANAATPKRASQRMRQAQLPLEIVANKGKFEKIPPTIHKGEDLDIPTYIRRGFALN
jgi:cell division protein FtsZ